MNRRNFFQRHANIIGMFDHSLFIDHSKDSKMTNKMWNDIHQQRIQDETLGDAAMELRDTLEELMGELDRIAEVDINAKVDPKKEDSFWLSGNIPATLVGRVRELLARVKPEQAPSKKHRLIVVDHTDEFDDLLNVTGTLRVGGDGGRNSFLPDGRNDIIELWAKEVMNVGNLTVVVCWSGNVFKFEEVK